MMRTGKQPVNAVTQEWGRHPAVPDGDSLCVPPASVVRAIALDGLAYVGQRLDKKRPLAQSLIVLPAAHYDAGATP